MKQEYSPFRSTATFKPQPECPDIDVHFCQTCQKSWQALGYGEHPPPSCCGRPAERLAPVSEAEAPEGFKITYSIVGGLNYDAVKIYWHGPAGLAPDWLLLKTFTGSYIRYVTHQKQAPMIFALADEDAYVYCDKAVCERCTFRCKRGFAIYACFLRPSPLLLEVNLDKVAPRFKTQML